MKTSSLIRTRSSHRQSGTAVIVVLALLSIILLYVAANVRSVSNLQRELKLTEQHQIRRLQALSGVTPPVTQTNAPPVVTPAPSL